MQPGAAIGSYGGSLKDVPAPALGAVVVREVLQRSGIEPAQVETAMGNVIQAGAKMNPARQAAIGGGLPVQVPALTVNRVCGSGAQAIATAAMEILSGYASCAIAGGMENMDQAPYLMPGGRWGYRMGEAQIFDSMLRDGLNDPFSGEHSGWHTEDLAVRNKITREDQDRWAERSQTLRRGANGRALRGRDRRGGGQGKEGRAGPSRRMRRIDRNDARGADDAQTGVSQRRHDHGRQRSGAQ